MSVIIAFIACGLGIALSLFMFLKKKSHKGLACPREQPCDRVLYSRFSKTLGIPNEILGVLYFFAVAFILLIPVSGDVTPWMFYLLFFVISLGGLFSLYLIGLKAFVIRSWCPWCVSIAATNLVLIVSLSNIPTEIFAPLLKSQKVWWVVIHNLGFILGIGSATITDLFFFRFLKDNKISQEEKEAMDTLTSIIWMGLAILVISGLALYVPDHARLSMSAKFLVKVVVVAVIAINGFFLNMFIAPYLRRLSFEGTVPARRFRRLAFALGGISITSWYLAFLLGSFRQIPISFFQGVIIYISCLIAVVVGSVFVEYLVTKNHQK